MRKKKLHRREQIVQLIEDRNYISLDDLVREIDISRVTIRRDLAELEQQGLIIRRFGGASSVKDLLIPKGIHPSHYADEDLFGQSALGRSRYRGQNYYDDSLDLDPIAEFEYDTKLQIAREAVERIQDNTRIIIDSGSTTGKMLNYIANKEKLQIMTNSLQTAYKLSQIPSCRRPRILLTGGSYDQSSDTFQGQIVKEVLHWYNFEQLFIGADGIDFNRGTTTIHEIDSYSQIMAEVSTEVIVLIESSKFGRKMPCVELPWDMINVLITDSKISDEDYDRLCKLGIEVVKARNYL